MQKILFVGLGRMGSNMAAHLSKSKHCDVAVWNRSPEKVEAWLTTYQGQRYSPHDEYDNIFLCVGNDNDVEGLLLTDQALFKQLKKGGYVIDHTTISADMARLMNESAMALGVNYLDAPVSGGEIGAINGTLSCMVGGQQSVLDRAKELLSLYCSNIVYIGASGAGQIAKMANQFCISGILAGLSEAICLIKKEGVDSQRVFDAISGGAAQSWQMDNRFKTMVSGEFDFGFAVDHMIKDLGYALELSNQQNWQPTVSAQVHQWYQGLSAQGYSNQDTSSLIKHYD